MLIVTASGLKYPCIYIAVRKAVFNYFLFIEIPRHQIVSSFTLFEAFWHVLYMQTSMKQGIDLDSTKTSALI